VCDRKLHCRRPWKMNGRSRTAITCQHRGRGADPQAIRAPPPMAPSGPPLHCRMITAGFGHAAELMRILDLRNTHQRHRSRPIGIAQECSSYIRASRSLHSEPDRMPRLPPPWPARHSRPRPQLPKPKARMQSSSLNVSLCFLHGHIAHVELRRHSWESYIPHALVTQGRASVAQKLPGLDNVRAEGACACDCPARE
jgi:hypothetical protein